MHSFRLSRRSMVTGAALGAGAIVAGRPGLATPVATPHSHHHGEAQFLAIADPAAETLAVVSLSTLMPVDRLDGVQANGHVGFIPLANGWLLFVDDLGGRLMAIEVHGDHLDTYEAAIPGETFSHIAIDSDHAHWAAVGSDDPATPITLVNLESWEATPVAIADAGEVGLLLSHDYLFHRNNNLNQIEAYLLDDLVSGSITPLSTAPIGTGGHGESISMTGDTLYTATDDGIEAVAWDGQELTWLTAYPWESTERSGGRGYFQRLSLDGTQVVSYTADRSGPVTDWPAWSNDAVLVDIADGITRRIELGDGYVFRFGLAHDRAVFYRMGGDGDEAIVLELPDGEISHRIPLEPMSTGPAADESIYERGQYRAVTATTDGHWGFVSQGGDGVVVMLDLEAGDVAGVIEAGSPLEGGGYLAVFGDDASFADTIGR